MIKFDKSLLSDIDNAIRKEWLVTNSLGGYACSTIICANTRRYHTVFTPALSPPVNRITIVSNLLEEIETKNNNYSISTIIYKDKINPDGYKYLTEFSYDSFPKFIFTLDDIIIEKKIMMPQKLNASIVTYNLQNKSQQDFILKVSLLLVCRNHHNLLSLGGIKIKKQIVKNNFLFLRLEGKNLPPLYVVHNFDKFTPSSECWLENVFYQVEEERGENCFESLFLAGNFSTKISTTGNYYLIFSTFKIDLKEVPELIHNTEKYATKKQIKPFCNSEFVKILLSAGNKFVAIRKTPTKNSFTTIIAGYPWFTDWGRDAFISFTGLFLVPQLYKEAREILLLFSNSIKAGLIPNTYDEETAKPIFNTVDASLWFIIACYKYLQYTGDWNFIHSNLWEKIKNIIDSYIQGTIYNIKMDSDGLIFAGTPEIQLTWMDAKVNNWVVTPRTGKPVEINALWYNALRISEMFAAKFNELQYHIKLEEIADQVKISFQKKFWNNKDSCLYDYINENSIPPIKDRSIRPNQIFVISLPYDDIISKKIQKKIVNLVKEKLLTPYGLRTLSADHPDYKGVYGGNRIERDSAYHQGTVWPYLLGPFISAWLKVNNYSKESQEEALKFLVHLKEHIFDAGVGNISEVFDGDPPHKPGGCFAQAWSVAEIIRTLYEDFAHSIVEKMFP